MALYERWQDIGARFAEKNSGTLNAERLKTIGSKIPRWLLVIGVILLAWQLAVITWFLVGIDTRDEAAPTLASSKTTHQSVPEQAQAFDLFEQERKAPKKANKPVRRNLNLLLHGVIARADPKQGSALISPKNSIGQVYRVGEQVSPGVTLDEIYPTYVLLLRGETYEELALPKASTGGLNKIAPAKPDNSALDGEPVVISTPRVTRKLARYRKQLKQNPMALARLLRGKPVMRNGKIHGVQISRGNDPTLINEIGLQDKDVLLSLNGISLNDIKQLPTLIKTLSEDERFEVMLERDGVAQSINIYLEM